MNPIAQKYGATGLAGVNLIPKEIAERKKMRTVQTVAVIAVLIAVGVVAAGFVLFYAAKQVVQGQYDDAVAAERAVVDARDGKAGVYADVVEREQQEYTLTQIGFGEMDYAQLTTALQQAVNPNTSFDEITIDGPSALGLGGGGQDPLFQGGVGTFNFVARATSFEEATALLQRMEAIPGIGGVRGVAELFTADGPNAYFEVSGAGVMTDARVTGRLLPVDGITGVDALMIIQAQDPEAFPMPSVSPEPSASPSPSASEEG